jgi:hypothetical protein
MGIFLRGYGVPEDGKEGIQGDLTEGTCCLGSLSGTLTDHGDGDGRLHWGKLQRTGGYLRLGLSYLGAGQLC